MAKWGNTGIAFLSQANVLKSACTFYDRFDTWVSNQNTPQVGSGTMVRSGNNSTSGLINDGIKTNNFDARGYQGDDFLKITDGNGDLIDFSFNLYTLPDSTNTGLEVIMGYSEFDGDPRQWILFCNNQTINLLIYNTNLSNRVLFQSSFTGFSTSNFNQFSANFNASDITSQMFLDGNELTVTKNDFNFDPTNVSNSNTMLSYFGNVVIGTVRRYNGIIDEVSFYQNYLITEEDSMQLYNDSNGVQLF